ncbi:MAG: chemotaxis protein CheC [Candidatus Omnitrophota bacterium]
MLKKIIVLTAQQEDVLKELGNICAGNAATALSQLLNKKIIVNIPHVHLVRIKEVPAIVGGPQKIMAGVVSQVFGDAQGIILLLFPQQSAHVLSEMFHGRQDERGIFTETDQWAIRETGSLLSAVYLNTLTKFTRLNLIPSTPGIIIDMAGALIDYLLIELSAVTEYALLIDSEFNDAGRLLQGHFLLLPNAGSLEAILDTIKEYNG